MGFLAGDLLSLDLASALAGDRPLMEAEKNRLGSLNESSSLGFFSDLPIRLPARISPEVAEDLWTEVVDIKMGYRCAVASFFVITKTEEARTSEFKVW